MFCVSVYQQGMFRVLSKSVKVSKCQSVSCMYLREHVQQGVLRVRVQDRVFRGLEG